MTTVDRALIKLNACRLARMHYQGMSVEGAILDAEAQHLRWLMYRGMKFLKMTVVCDCNTCPHERSCWTLADAPRLRRLFTPYFTLLLREAGRVPKKRVAPKPTRKAVRGSGRRVDPLHRRKGRRV